MKVLTLNFKENMFGFHFWVNVLAYKALLKKLFGIILFYGYGDWNNSFFFFSIVLGMRKLN